MRGNGMKGRWLYLCVAILLSCLPVFGQQSEESGRIPTVEELYLRNPTLMAIVEQATSADRETKLLALDDIQQLIEDDNVGSDASGVLDMLEYLSAEGVLREVKQNGQTVNYFPIVRRRAVELIGKLAQDTSDPDIKRRAQEILLTILQRDGEVMVKAEAAYALGLIGEDENGVVVRTLYDIIAAQTVAAPDNNFAYAVCLAVEKIVEANDGDLDSAAYADLARTLVRIAQGNYIKTVRRKALQTLEVLKEYQS